MPADQWAALLWLGCWLVALSVVDLRTRRLPDSMVLATLVGLVVIDTASAALDRRFVSPAWADAGAQPVNELIEPVLQGIPTLDGWEHIGLETTCSETMFLGLRLLDGLNLSDASALISVDLAEKFRTPIQECIQLGLLEQDGDCLKLTKPAYLIANQVFTRFVG